MSVTLADFNNDRVLDITVANNNIDSIDIFLGYGNGSFAPVLMWRWRISDHDCNQCILLGHGDGIVMKQIIYAIDNGSKSYSVAVGDFNSDTILDIAVANFGSNDVRILLGYGNGNFSIRASYSTGDLSGPPSIAIADFNRDCFLGIAVANWNSKDVVLLYGKGDSTFEKPYSYLMGYGSVISTVAIDDFNRDNWTDISVANYGTSHTGIRLQTCDNI
ncbi:unnamed protein product [Rotaria socialis]|uniref:VCBS repeat-containing protein n=1 Tax=Rotaria socialis TaxID=392032 RepID=A0A818VX28_9BILA|nr:unnamed protein product [Rotaria socialis]